jgi:hypothetical protein
VAAVLSYCSPKQAPSRHFSGKEEQALARLVADEWKQGNERLGQALR